MNDLTRISPTEKASSRFYYGYAIVGLSFIIGAVAWGSQRTFGVFLDWLLKDPQLPGWSRAEASLAITIQSIVTAVMAILAGRLSDKYGPRVILTVCGIAMGIGLILSSFMTNLLHLYLLQGVAMGIGLAGVMVPLTSAVVRWFTHRAGLMNGLVHAGLGVGISTVPLLVAWIIQRSDWRQAYLWIGALALVVIVASSQFLKRNPAQPQTISAGDHAGSKTVASARSFTFREALGTRAYWLLSLLFFGDVFCINIVMVHMVIHARDLRIPEAQAVSLLSVTAATSIIGRISAGVVADRLGIRWTIGIGLGASLIAFVWLLFADRLWMLYVFAVIYGYGGWAVGAVISPVVAEFFGFKSHGVILGAVNAAGTLGGAVGPLIAGAIYDRMKNYDRAFITCAAVSGICLILLAFLRKTPEGGKT